MAFRSSSNLAPFEIREFPVPEPRPGGLTLRVTRANICGSELHIWRGDGRFGHFDAPEKKGAKVTIDAAYVGDKLADIVKSEDLSRYIL